MRNSTYEKDKEIIKVAGVRNFRGLGGIKAGDKVIKRGIAFRCASLFKIKEEGIKTLQKLNIRYDFDLRTQSEKERKPDPKIEGITLCEFDILGAKKSELKGEKHNSYRAFLLSAKPMPELYEMMLRSCDDVLQGAIQQGVYAILHDEPFLFHCTEGKDRTGIIAFLLLGMLGVSEEDIFSDYIYTNKVAYHAARKTAWATLPLGLKATKIAYELTIASKRYFDSAFAYLRSRGGIVEYAASSLGIDEATIQALKDKCLE